MCDCARYVTTSSREKLKDEQMGSEPGGRTETQVKNRLSAEGQDLQSFLTSVTLSNLIPAESSISDLQHFFVAINFSDVLAFFSPPTPLQPICSFSNLSQNKKSISPPHHFHTLAMPVARETTHYSPGDRSFPLAAPFDWPVSRWGCWGLNSFDWLAGWQRQRPQQTFCKEHWFNRLACGQTAESHTHTHM